MRQKELRIALVCYGGISLAVYMHGVTKEVWHAARASRNFVNRAAETLGTAGVYQRLLQHIEQDHGLRLRLLPDIVAGASAGGINGVFLAQALHSGQSLDPITRLWLERADVDALLDPEARRSRFAKLWAMPLVWFALTRPGNMIAASVAPETRTEVRAKFSRLIRSRWFEPPFSGIGFSRMLAEALDAMAASTAEPPALPPGHPLDLFVTATDYKGHLERLRLHSPAEVEESEHRLSIGFRAPTPPAPGGQLANPLELIFAARATASFPGAFPALQLAEVDALAAERKDDWSSRTAFYKRIMPEHSRRGELGGVALIDGSVLVNAPFAEAMAVLRDRPANREIDRRFVYIDPTPNQFSDAHRLDPKPPGFLPVILGSLSGIPREQPVQDNLAEIERHSRELTRLRGIVDALRPEVDEAVEKLFDFTLFLDRPNPKRMLAWRKKAQEAAASRAGFAWHGYAQIKFTSVIDMLAETIHHAAPELGLTSPEPIAARLTEWLAARGLKDLSAPKGGATAEAIAFFQDFDLGYRIRRLRLLARRLTQDWDDTAAEPAERERARDAVYKALSLYFERETAQALGEEFPELAARVFEDPGPALEAIATHRRLAASDLAVDEILATMLTQVPQALRRRVLLAYLGFPFYDTVTLPLLRGEGLTEFDPAKVDRISPDDCSSIRPGGSQATLRGIEFYHFGAFFSRAYRENDYLWGRLHGAERMIDLIASALPEGEAIDPEVLRRFKHEAFLAVLDEEDGRLLAEPGLVAGVRAEVQAAFGT
jgi:patatin-related protein